jgi:hypothetical protein
MITIGRANLIHDSSRLSAKTTDGRKEFKRLMKDLLPGDTVVVTKLDRLARFKPRSAQHPARTSRAILWLRIAWGKLVRHDHGRTFKRCPKFAPNEVRLVVSAIDPS